MRGNAGERRRFVGREQGYHGVNFGGMSVDGMGPNRKIFSANLFPGVDHLPHAMNLQYTAFSRGQLAWGAHLTDDFIRIAALRGPSTDRVMTGPEAMPELFHGYIYSVHPVAADAGPAALDIYEEEGAFADARSLETLLENVLHNFKSHFIDDID